ncbi:hypothetical protein CPB85DRAFT_618970 [Mucidula mucida]|nr:hypothetical protein CPB85DRAFT_618970 [Mucidula mucida]
MVHFRGRAYSNTRLNGVPPLKKSGAPAVSPSRTRLVHESNPIPFTRSRSPIVNRASTHGRANMRNASPAVFSLPVSAQQGSSTTVLPSQLQLHVHFALLPWAWTFCIDSKKAGECLLLLGSLTYASSKLADISSQSQLSLAMYNLWIITGEASYCYSCIQ